MEKQIKDIEKDIMDNQILITEPRNINISTKKLLRKNEKSLNFEEKNNSLQKLAI